MILNWWYFRFRTDIFLEFVQCISSTELTSGVAFSSTCLVYFQEAKLEDFEPDSTFRKWQMVKILIHYFIISKSELIIIEINFYIEKV